RVVRSDGDSWSRSRWLPLATRVSPPPAVNWRRRPDSSTETSDFDDPSLVRCAEVTLSTQYGMLRIFFEAGRFGQVSAGKTAPRRATGVSLLTCSDGSTDSPHCQPQCSQRADARRSPFVARSTGY